MLVEFRHGERRAELTVERTTMLRHVQQNLCALFGERFPLMKANLKVNDVTYDEFCDLPFAACDVDAVAAVTFASTDDPLFYDIADRCGIKATIEDELTWECETEKGITDLTFEDWVAARRANVRLTYFAALKEMPAPWSRCSFATEPAESERAIP